MPESDHYVIIGNGPAGNSAADCLRKNDSKARITIVSGESFSFYFKHKLTGFITGAVDESKLIVRPYSIYKTGNIRLRLGQHVEKIDPEKKILYFSHMEKVGYTRLIIATGGSPRILPSLMNFNQYLTFMYCYTDAVKLAAELDNWNDCLVIGGDITSIKFIEMLAEKKKNIHVTLYPEAFWPFALSAEITETLKSRFEQKGIRVNVNKTVESITRKDKQYSITSKDGDNEIYDRIFSFLGLVPNIKFILGSGIDTDIGVLVDDHLRTNFNDIYACGDCAQIYNSKTKNYWVSIGWKNAQAQGKAAALNLLGDNEVIKPFPEKVLSVDGISVKTSWWDLI